MSNNYNLCVSDFEKICRTCMAEGEMKFLYEKCPETVCFTEMLNSISSVQFSEKDRLPIQICLNCVSEICRAYNFTKKCADVDKKLKKCLKEFEENSISSQVDLQIKTEIEIEEHKYDKNLNSEILIIKPETSEEDYYKIDGDLYENKYTNEYYDSGNYEFMEVKSELLSETENIDYEEKDKSDDSDFLPENKNSDTNLDDKTNEEKQKTTESKTGPPYECKKCSKKFITYKFLKLHWKQVKHPKVENCEICSKTIKSCNMRMHMKTHSGEKPFCCEVCQMKFLTKNHLQRHFRTHTGEKPYTCTVCKKGFRVSYTLTEHMRIHTGEKPYVCGYCGKRCAVKRNLDLHMKKHTREKRYQIAMFEDLLDGEITKTTPTNDSTVHVLRKITTKNQKGETNRKRCRACSQQNIRKMTLYNCEKCPGKPGLCVGECFENFHA